MRRLPAALRRRGCRLLNQQCWLWGQDVKAPEGNLLLRHGFARLRPPEDVVGCTQYTLPLGPGLRLKLWGFGIFLGEAEGLYLNRFEFFPRLVSGDDAWQAQALGRPRRARELSALPRLLRWVAGYEEWVHQTESRGYRQRCLGTWKQPVCAAEELPQQWAALAEDTAQALNAS